MTRNPLTFALLVVLLLTTTVPVQALDPVQPAFPSVASPERSTIFPLEPVPARQPFDSEHLWLLHARARQMVGPYSALVANAIGLSLPFRVRYAAGEGRTEATDRPFAAAGTCTVTATVDSGVGSLRQCLLSAVAGDRIVFDLAVFSPVAPATIPLLSALPWIRVNQLAIDGSNAGVVLDGSRLSEGSGLVVSGADGVTIRGLQVRNFPWDGIALIAGTKNAIIGGDSTVGSTPLGQGNLVSSNAEGGIVLFDMGTTSNRILGNRIGTDTAGISGIGNGVAGVIIGFSASDNIVGGNTAGERNLISGNGRFGVVIDGAGSVRNRVVGNYIGTDASGANALGNGEAGILIQYGASDNTVGGNTSTQRNVISGNARTGVWIDELGTDRNVVAGNYIGIDTTGTRGLGNGRTGAFVGNHGVFVGFGARDNLIGGNTTGAGNIISANGEYGVQLQDTGTTGNRVLGNYIGTDKSGTVALGNAKFGVGINYGASSNTIGGEGQASNLISGNGQAGVLIQYADTSDNLVMGNRIGTDALGLADLGNGDFGVFIGGGAKRNHIGGSATGAGNLISGNGLTGVDLYDVGTSENEVLGNYIGANATGTQALPNGEIGVAILGGASYNTIGGTTPGTRNLVSGNGRVGIWIEGVTTANNLVRGNYIGVDSAGMDALGNGEIGVLIYAGAHHNWIGGEMPGARNLISGNGAAPAGGSSLAGVWIEGAGTTGNLIQDNYIGTDLTGARALGNRELGVFIGHGASANIVGGNTPAARNIVSASNADAPGDAAGIWLEGATTASNIVAGNYIGTDQSGTADLGNDGQGVIITQGAHDNTIGGVTTDAGNLISGNAGTGVWLQLSGTSSNRVIGNRIGSNASGTQALKNDLAGVVIIAGASGNSIGEEPSGTGNLISGNDGDGIVLQDLDTLGNSVTGNLIGADISSIAQLPNAGFGIALTENCRNNRIGPGNTIAFNLLGGVAVNGSQTLGNTITRNRIFSNEGLPIQSIGAPLPEPPTLANFSPETWSLTGRTCSRCTVEVFANPDRAPAGWSYLAIVTADSQGSFGVDLQRPLPDPCLAGTATDTDGTTSEFSTGLCVWRAYQYLPLIVR